MQRNTIREHAYHNNYDWLFCLDSDIHLNHNTIDLLLRSKRLCVGVCVCIYVVCIYVVLYIVPVSLLLP